MWPFRKRPAPAPVVVASMQAMPLGINLKDQTAISAALARMNNIAAHISERPITEQRRAEFLSEARVSTACLVVAGAMSPEAASDLIGAIQAAPSREVPV